jgi:hypothetical protein
MARPRTRPGYELDYTCQAGRWRIRLLPVMAHLVWDTVNTVTVRTLMRYGGWIAKAVEQADGWWLVTTQAGGKGGRRYRHFQTETDAVSCLERWYLRRFRFDQRQAAGRPLLPRTAYRKYVLVHDHSDTWFDMSSSLAELGEPGKHQHVEAWWYDRRAEGDELIRKEIVR